MSLLARQWHSSHPAWPVRRIEGAKVTQLRTRPRLQALPYVSRWLKGQPPAQTGAESIQIPSFSEGGLTGLNFWDRATGFAKDRRIHISDGGSIALRPVRSTYGGEW